MLHRNSPSPQENQLLRPSESGVAHELLGGRFPPPAPAPSGRAKRSSPRTRLAIMGHCPANDDLALCRDQIPKSRKSRDARQESMRSSYRHDVERRSAIRQIFNSRMDQIDVDVPATRLAARGFQRVFVRVNAGQRTHIGREAKGDSAGPAGDVKQPMLSRQVHCCRGLGEEFLQVGFAVAPILAHVHAIIPIGRRTEAQAVQRAKGSSGGSFSAAIRTRMSFATSMFRSGIL